MSRYEFAQADAPDDAELRRRMAEVWMEGRIAVSFRREPSYFAGCRLQGDTVQVIKCTDTDTGRIVGMGSRLKTAVNVDGRPLGIGYLADLRSLLAIRRGTLVARGYRFLRALHMADPVPFYLTLIVDTNEAALSNLVGGRAGLPPYVSQGRILTPAIHLDAARPPLEIAGISFRRADAGSMPQVRAFLRELAPGKQFSPLYAGADFATGGRFASLHPADFFVARDGSGQIAACLAAWDQSAVRQTHVERYPAALGLLRPLYNLASRLTALKPLPPAGGKLAFVYLSCIAVRGNDLALFRGLLRHACNALRTGPWHFAIAGLHEGDPLAAALHDYRRIEAAGHLFLVHYPRDGQPVPVLDARPRYFEMALA